MLANTQLHKFLEISPALGVLVLFCLAVFVVCMVLNYFENKSRRKFRQRKIKIKVAEIQEQRVQEQIRKPSFEVRLQQFAEGKPRNQQHDSRMPYWQSDDLELKPVPPRPIEFFRTLLIRLKKLLILGTK